MTADAMLSRLDKVRKRSADQWSARCPAHDDKAPSLSVREMPDGRVLLRCFAGCAADEVVGAVGLDLFDLFPPKLDGHRVAPLRRRGLLTAAQALDLLHAEAQFVGVIASNIADGVAIDDDDRARTLKAAGRIAYLRDEAMA